MDGWDSIWNTIEGLSKLNTVAQWATVIFGLLTAVAVGLSLLASNRKDQLKELALRREQREWEEERARLRSRMDEAEKAAKDSAAATEATKAELSSARSKLADIEARQAPRSLSPEQRKAIVTTLRPYPGTTVSVTKLGDAEGGSYADAIVAALQAADWKVIVNFIGMLSPPRYGVICSIPSPGRPDATALLSAFRQADVHVEVVQRAGSPEGPIQILVGLKPPH